MAKTSKGRWEVERYVAYRISQLQNGLLLQNNSRARALLAELRRGLTAEPGSLPDTWEIEFGELPKSLLGNGSAPATAGEWAVHLGLVLYASHQQSQQAPMYRKTDIAEQALFGFGNSVRRLADKNRSTGQGERLVVGEMPRRFKAMITSETIEEFAHYTRQIVAQLRSAGIPIDYGAFAGQIFDYQNPYKRDSVRLEWAREFSQPLEGADPRQDGSEPSNH